MTHINQRRDTATNWAAANPVLQLGELGWETNTRKAKLGDGVTAWNSLAYAVTPTQDLSAYAPLANPVFTGNPTAPTPLTGDNDTSVATTAFVKAQGYATTASIAGKADLASPVFTGNPTAPTPATGDDDTSIATTAFVKAQGYVTAAQVSGSYAPLASPAFTGTPTAPTPGAGDNDTSVATTAFVTGAVSTAVAGKADLAGPAFTGNPTAPTPPTADNDTSLATTAFVKAQGYLTSSSLGTAAYVNTGTTSGTVALLNASGRFDMARLGSGTPDGSKFLRDDGTFAAPPGGGGGSGTGDVVGPGVSVSGNIPVFNGTSGKIITDSGMDPTDFAGTDSPAFTGTPTAPTPATSDNDSSIATTMFVKNQGYAVLTSLATVATTGSALDLTATGTKNNTTYLRGDDTWATIPAGMDAEGVRDTIGTALVGTGVVTVTPNDATETITVSSTATVNSPDATLLNRANHTGTQTKSTISDFAHTHGVTDLTATGTRDATTFLRGDNTWQTVASGTGDVVGPAGATNNRIAVYDGATGKLIKDGGVTIADLQPSDGDLTAIAALTTTAYGRSILTLADQAALVGLLPSYQPADADLTAIAGLTATSDNVVQSVSGNWASRTPAQLKATLALAKGDVGLGNVPNVDATARANHTGTQTKSTISDFAHTHGVTDLTATGTKDSTTFLRGDNTWGVPAGAFTQTQADLLYAKNVQGGAEKVAALSASSGTATGNLANASIFTISPSGNFTIAFSNVPASGTACTVTVIVTQGSSAYTITYPANTKWMGAPAPTQAANKMCVITMVTVNGGTVWNASGSVEQ